MRTAFSRLPKTSLHACFWLKWFSLLQCFLSRTIERRATAFPTLLSVGLFFSQIWARSQHAAPSARHRSETSHSRQQVSSSSNVADFLLANRVDRIPRCSGLQRAFPRVLQVSTRKTTSMANFMFPAGNTRVWRNPQVIRYLRCAHIHHHHCQGSPQCRCRHPNTIRAVHHSSYGLARTWVHKQRVRSSFSGSLSSGQNTIPRVNLMTSCSALMV